MQSGIMKNKLNPQSLRHKKNPEPKWYPDFSKLTQLNFYQVHVEELEVNLKIIKTLIFY